MMSGQKRRSRRAPKKLVPTGKPSWTGIRRVTAVILGVSTIVGVPAAVIAFWPRMTVVPSGLVEETNAYSQIFTVTNTGFLPFEDMHMGLGICSIETEKHDFFISGDNCDAGGPRLLFTGSSWQTPELRRDEPFTVVLTDALNTPTDRFRSEHPNVVLGTQMMSRLKAMNALFAVSFKPWPWPWHIRFRYRFVASEQPNGKVIWRSVPLSWKDIDLPK
jgi:hypothetical protein